MRIYFKPVQPNTKDNLFKIVAENDLVDMLNPSKIVHFDNVTIFDEQQYTDESRYNLNLFKARFDRCYKHESEVPASQTRLGIVQVISLDLNFNMDFDFRLLSKDFTNYWNNDVDIDFIKPSVTVYNTFDIGYYAFRSLATSYFAKALSLIKTNDILCFKRGKRIILAYNLTNDATIYNLDDILDNFLNAVYEMVKVTSGRMGYAIPEERTKTVDLETWYTDRLAKQKNKPKRKYFYYKD